MTARPHVLVVDPALKGVEHACFNAMALASPLPCTFHLPALYGMISLAEEDLDAVRGIVILGSSASVHEHHPWQETLAAWLVPLVERGVPTLGICYGHQLLAHMLGGEVGFVYPDHHKISGVRDVRIDATPCWPAATGPLIVSHRETVTKPPASMRVFARSAGGSAQGPEILDGLYHERLPLWTFQSHPEATPAFLIGNAVAASERREEAMRFGQALVRGFLEYAASKTP